RRLANLQSTSVSAGTQGDHLVTPVVLLDSGPLGLLCHTRRSAVTVACEHWLASLLATGRRVIVPEITDYEVRRELLRIGRPKAIARLDALTQVTVYLPLTRPALHGSRRSQPIALARRQGYLNRCPTYLPSEVPHAHPPG